MQEMYKNELSGYLLINKPSQITSFFCVSRIKRFLNKKIKIGHAGTLDPIATGLLIICIGREKTKTIDRCLPEDKQYLVTAKLGELTDTLDYTGKLINQITTHPQAIDDIIKAIKKNRQVVHSNATNIFSPEARRQASL